MLCTIHVKGSRAKRQNCPIRVGPLFKPCRPWRTELQNEQICCNGGITFRGGLPLCHSLTAQMREGEGCSGVSYEAWTLALPKAQPSLARRSPPHWIFHDEKARCGFLLRKSAPRDFSDQ